MELLVGKALPTNSGQIALFCRVVRPERGWCMGMGTKITRNFQLPSIVGRWGGDGLRVDPAHDQG